MKKLILMLMLFAPMATFAQKFGHVNAGCYGKPAGFY